MNFGRHSRWGECCLAALVVGWMVPTAGCTDSPQKDDLTTGLEWVALAGGSYEQGNANPAENMTDELPVRTVLVATFDMLQTEVTVAQYAACVNAKECMEPELKDDGNWGAPGKEDHPVNYVSWSDAIDFCNWVGGRPPTESEWEYAARNQGSDIYPWGDEAATCERAVMESEEGSGCGSDSTMAVCSKPAGNTKFGLCDMIGNLWEWTLDWYHESYAGAPTDGTPWVEPRGKTRTMRGGAFSYDAFWNRATARDSHGNPAFKVRTLGFRCVRGADVDADYDAPIIEEDAGGDYNECGEKECDFMCLADPCVNADGNTHTDCGCDADYCVPDEAGVEFAGLTPLSCTTANCDPDNAATCPEGTECSVIPAFVVDMFAEKGIIMPPTMCGGL